MRTPSPTCGSRACAKATGREIVETDFTGQAEPGLEVLGGGPPGETSASMLASLRFNPTTREAVRAADIILISTGSNDLYGVIWDPPAGVCGGSFQVECVRAVGRLWTSNFDAILDEIDCCVTAPRPRIRLIGAANWFLADPQEAALLYEASTGALIVELLSEAQCAAAVEHGAVCVDVRPIETGPNFDQPGDDYSAATMRAIADALIATGLPELE